MMEYRMSIADFKALVAGMEKERGYRIGGFALVEKTGQWKVIQRICDGGKSEFLDNIKTELEEK